MSVQWADALAHALELPGTVLSTSYGQPAVKLAANGRAFLFTGHEPLTSFGVAIDLATIEMLKETDPDTFWQSPHYEGYAAVLIRYETTDPERVVAVISQSRDWIAAKTPVVPRKRR